MRHVHDQFYNMHEFKCRNKLINLSKKIIDLYRFSIFTHIRSLPLCPSAVCFDRQTFFIEGDIMR